VLGAVELWGRVVEHDAGFRAEHARVVALVGHASTAAFYGAAPYPTWEALLAEWPPSPPVELAS
jgi:hypothetical protein